MSDATAELLTPPGRGAVATIRLTGNGGILDGRERLFSAVNGKPVAEQQVGRIVFGHWGHDPAEEVVLCRRDEQTVEINCHGGRAAVDRILSDLRSAGCEIAQWQDALKRRDGMLAAECAEALARATTLRTAAVLLDQQQGALQRAIEKLRALDSQEAAVLIGELLGWADFGLHLTKPWSVVLVGRPNVGKSSLINALVGYARAIVFDQPGTTRDVVTAETALQGWPIQFADTAGIRTGADELEAAGIELARAHLQAADCRVIVLDRSQPPGEDDRKLLADWPDAIVAANKSDLPDRWQAELPDDTFAVSALKREGIDELAAAITTALVPHVPETDAAVPFTRRQIQLLESARRKLEIGDKDWWQNAAGRVVG